VLALQTVGIHFRSWTSSRCGRRLLTTTTRRKSNQSFSAVLRQPSLAWSLSCGSNFDLSIKDQRAEFRVPFLWSTVVPVGFHRQVKV